MNNANPYTPPEASLSGEPDTENGELASRGQRFGAAFVDGLLAIAWSVPLMYAFGIFEYQNQGEEPPFSTMLLFGALGFLIFTLIHGYLLHKNGQTIGKKLLSIRITDLNDNVPPLSKLLGWRYLPISVVSLIPVVGTFLPLVDALFVFRSDRRCIHDLIAGTKVVQVAKD